MPYDSDERKGVSKLDIQLDIPDAWKKELNLDKMTDRFEDAGEPFSGIFLFLVAIMNNMLTDMREIKELLKDLQKRV